MVFYFTLLSNPNVICYMGRDKYENEELIRWGWPEDIWVHVSDHSSAHVYIRFPKGSKMGMDDLTPPMIEEMCQLCKANSIEGSKLNNVKIVYTPWSNLKKTNDMDVGAIGFHDERLRRYYTVDKKDNALLKHHEKGKADVTDVNFREEREQRDAEVRRMERDAEKAAAEKKKQADEDLLKMKDQKHYTSLMADDKMKVNNNTQNLEDDFM